MAIKTSFKAKWVAALRSGEYRQGKSALRKKGAYCCLGVACLVAKYKIDPKTGTFYVNDGGLLKNATSRALGIGSTQDELADMNDAGRSFAEIADWIEANL